MIPSYEDLVKYQSQKYSLLISLDCYNTPFEARVARLSSDGEYVSLQASFNSVWCKCHEVDVLDIFAPPLGVTIPAGRIMTFASTEDTEAYKEYMSETQPAKGIRAFFARLFHT